MGSVVFMEESDGVERKKKLGIQKGLEREGRVDLVKHIHICKMPMRQTFCPLRHLPSLSCVNLTDPAAGTTCIKVQTLRILVSSCCLVEASRPWHTAMLP